ncbi:ThuA domain-containing protein [Actinospica durhamensis]|uniref:ThuA domain-containing protein n=1 Tax=Actinospica durhamensis TaxID=1508375 RepID=A0A941ELY9_9ACTN|nr:ThuA domain-containing protein [Actinospica durhamensis]MBR7833318.1 ThuA domain-containing protein [Actinospica durhamensis]
MSQAPRRAMVVHGRWKGHAPARIMGLFIAFLQEHGYVVAVSNDLDVYTHATLMARTDLIVQCWTTDPPGDDQIAGLRGAVEAGVGFVGWHGGGVESFPGSPAYLQLTGARFIAHPGGLHPHSIHLVPASRDHEIVRDLPPEIKVEDRQYWVLSDPYNEVLATTTIPARAGDAWSDPITVPAIWTRRWGAGRVFACSPGHHVPTLEIPEIRTIVERGMLWASR